MSPSRVVIGDPAGTTVRLAISTCPNDTFAFAAILDQRVDCLGLCFEIDLLDIAQLNQRVLTGQFDVAKASFYAALRSKDVEVLPVGSALGFGVGPILLAHQPNAVPRDLTQVTLCPGQYTTARMLFDLFYRNTTQVKNVVFSEIMPQLAQRQADFGVCIHEGRFTYQASGLYLADDLGARWESATGQPLPLGGIVARCALGAKTIRLICQVISMSLKLARNDPEKALPQMRRYAQSMDDAVLMQHVDLYVNEWTTDLGAVGRAALAELSRQASLAGLINDHTGQLRVFE